MQPTRTGTPYDEFLAAAEGAAAVRPDVDLELARELMLEAATMLDDGLAFEGLDDHDTRAAAAALATDLVAEDPGAAVRARAEAMRESAELHDPESVSRSCLLAAAMLQL